MALKLYYQVFERLTGLRLATDRVSRTNPVTTVEAGFYH